MLYVDRYNESAMDCEYLPQPAVSSLYIPSNGMPLPPLLKSVSPRQATKKETEKSTPIEMSVLGSGGFGNVLLVRQKHYAALKQLVTRVSGMGHYEAQHHVAKKIIPGAIHVTDRTTLVLKFQFHSPLHDGIHASLLREWAWSQVLQSQKRPAAHVLSASRMLLSGYRPDIRAYGYDRQRLSHSASFTTVPEVIHNQPALCLEPLYDTLWFAQRDKSIDLRQQMLPQVTLDCLYALQTLHSAQLMHRDISPSNIMLGEGGRAWLIDLGQCMPYGAQVYTHFQNRALCSPFHLRGDQYTPTMDVWSLACTLLYFGCSTPILSHDAFRTEHFVNDMQQMEFGDTEAEKLASTAADTNAIGAWLKLVPVDLHSRETLVFQKLQQRNNHTAPAWSSNQLMQMNCMAQVLARMLCLEEQPQLPVIAELINHPAFAKCQHHPLSVSDLENLRERKQIPTSRSTEFNTMTHADKLDTSLGETGTASPTRVSYEEPHDNNELLLGHNWCVPRLPEKIAVQTRGRLSESGECEQYIQSQKYQDKAVLGAQIIARIVQQQQWPLAVWCNAFNLWCAALPQQDVRLTNEDIQVAAAACLWISHKLICDSSLEADQMAQLVPLSRVDVHTKLLVFEKKIVSCRNRVLSHSHKRKSKRLRFVDDDSIPLLTGPWTALDCAGSPMHPYKPVCTSELNWMTQVLTSWSTMSEPGVSGFYLPPVHELIMRPISTL